MSFEVSSRETVGGVLESSGEFTVNPRRARGALARYQFEDLSYAVLCLVQAAGLSRCDCSVTLSKVVRFEIPQYHLGFPLKDFEAHLLDEVQSNKLTSANCLLRGINAFLEQTKEPIKLFQGDEVLDIREGQARPSQPIEGLRLEFSIPKASRLKAKKLLLERCGVCPVAVMVDGKQASGNLGQTELFGVDHRNIADIVEKGPQEFHEIQVQPILDRETIEGERSAWFVLWSGANRRSVVRLTRAGVIVDYQTLDMGIPGLVATVAADDLSTDISGMRVSEADFETLTPWIRDRGTSLAYRGLERARFTLSTIGSGSGSGGRILKGLGIGIGFVAACIVLGSIGAEYVVCFLLLSLLVGLGAGLRSAIRHHKNPTRTVNVAAVLKPLVARLEKCEAIQKKDQVP